VLASALSKGLATQKSAPSSLEAHPGPAALASAPGK